MTKPKSEKRQFNVHSKLMFDTIFRQAGTLAKAILEGIMNAGDAKCQKLEITLTPNELLLVDDGDGIQERRQIETWFETFGHPHEDSEGKTWGTFRMGRGQLFAYGVNHWRTGPFEMRVDAKNEFPKYHLTTMKKKSQGCQIRVELYSPLLPSDLNETVRLVTHWAKYAPFPVFLNGTRISRDPTKESWDYVLPEAYIRLKDSGTLSVFNLGIHTLDMDGTRFGTGGEIVSRQQLKVNFARNDIQSDCSVWKVIKPKVDQYATERNAKSKSLDDKARNRLAYQFAYGELDWGRVRELRLVTAVNGRQYSLDHVTRLYSYGYKISSCQKGNRLGDKLFQSKVAFILADETLERFSCKDVPALIAMIRTTTCKYLNPPKMEYVSFGELSKGFSTDYELLGEKDLKPNEIIWLRLLGRAKYSLALEHEDRTSRYFATKGQACARTLVIGVSQQAHGWTDGESYVAIGREFLAKEDFDIKGFGHVGKLLLHEFCHAEPDQAEHIHSQEFYELFHNSSQLLGEFVAYCVSTIDKVLQGEGRKLSKKVLAIKDETEKTRRRAGEFSGIGGAAQAYGVTK